MSEAKQHSFFQRLSLLMVGVVSVLAFAYAIIGNNGYLELRRREARNQELKLKAEELRRENKEILNEIRTQYVIGYVPSGIDAGRDFHKIQVSLNDNPNQDRRVAVTRVDYSTSTDGQAKP